MRKKLPTRTEVLAYLGSEDRPFHVREIAAKHDVPQANIEGLLRLIDDMIFDGTVVSRGGQRFYLDTKKDEKKAEKIEQALPVSKVTLPKGKKGLPSSATQARSRSNDREMPGFRESGGPRETSGGPRDARGARDTRDARGQRETREAPQRVRGAAGERREGSLKINPRGFGFVASPTAAGDDIFIPAESLGGAMHGDTVIVDIVARGSRGPEGSIVEIKTRGSVRVSGILRRRGKSAWVEPDDPRVRGPIVLTREIDTVGAEGNSGQDGQVAVVQITRFPEVPDQNPEGKLIAILGSPGELSVETRKVLFLAQVEEVHSDQAVAEAESFGLEVPAAMLEGREDLTGIPLPTIDPDDARDHDDAVWVAKKGDGFELWVAIADVSSYVTPGTYIDAEAKARGCSIYLPDRAIPMLPRALSSSLCSLLPDVVRLCLCVHAELDAKGNVTKSRLIRGYMKSAAKLTYGGVARALGFSDIPPIQPKAEEMVAGLRVAYDLSRLLRGKRMTRGALDFDLPEAVIKLDADGKPISVGKRAQDLGVKKAYQLIEELMIFANEVVARWLVSNDIPGVYRVHLPPDPKKLDRLGAMCEMLGIELDVEDTQTPQGLSDTLKRFADHPLAAVLNNLLLRSMKQATYDVQNLGHFGLASDAYLHFTSPIRRYPDLVVHRQVHAFELREKRQIADKETLAEAAAASSIAERRAMEIEREIVDIYRCFFMIDKIGQRFEGTVGAFVGAGAFVTLDDPFVDVMIRTEDMGPDFQIDDGGLMASSKRSGDALRLGDRIMVEIADCAILRRTVYARWVRGDGEGASARKPKPDMAGNERRGFGGKKKTDTRPARPERPGDKRKNKGGATGKTPANAPNNGRKSGKGFGKKGKAKKR